MEKNPPYNVRKFLFILFPVSLIVTCLAFNFSISNHFSNKTINSDEVLYDSIAMAILNGNNYYMEGAEKVDIGHEVTPFYSCFVAAAYFVGGVNHRNPYILNVILNCFTIILLFLTISLITKEFFLSFLFSFVFIFYYPLWRMNYTILMEVTTVFFFSLGIYLFTQYYYKKKNKYIYFSTAVFSLVCLINNRFIVLLFVLLTFLLFITIIKKYKLGKTFIIPVLIAFLTLSPWFIRQYIEYKQFVFFTPTWNNVVADKIGFFKKINIKTDADYKSDSKPLTYSEYVQELRSESLGELQQIRISAFTAEKYKEVIDRHNYNGNLYFDRLKKYFTLYYKDFQFQSPTDFRLIAPSSKTYKLVQLLILLPLFIFSLLGVLIAIKKREMIIIFLTMLFLSHVVLHVSIHYIERYRLTILPVLLIIAAYGFLNIIPILSYSRRGDYALLN